MSACIEPGPWVTPGVLQLAPARPWYLYLHGGTRLSAQFLLSLHAPVAPSPSTSSVPPVSAARSLTRPLPLVRGALSVSLVIPKRPRTRRGLRAHDACRGRTRPTSTISKGSHPHYLSLLPLSRTRRAPALTSHRAHNREALPPFAVAVEPSPCLLPR
jgi:hypothetical protein